MSLFENVSDVVEPCDEQPLEQLSILFLHTFYQREMQGARTIVQIAEDENEPRATACVSAAGKAINYLREVWDYDASEYTQPKTGNSVEQVTEPMIVRHPHWDWRCACREINGHGKRRRKP